MGLEWLQLILVFLDFNGNHQWLPSLRKKIAVLTISDFTSLKYITVYSLEIPKRRHFEGTKTENAILEMIYKY